MIISAENQVFRVLGGWFLLLHGLVILITSAATLFLNRTAIFPNQPASRLIQSGPYRFSRNPMYMAIATSYVGMALLTNMLWALMLLPVVLLVLHVTVIRREERYLQQAFGPAYADYCHRVRRWC